MRLSWSPRQERKKSGAIVRNCRSHLFRINRGTTVRSCSKHAEASNCTDGKKYNMDGAVAIFWSVRSEIVY